MNQGLLRMAAEGRRRVATELSWDRSRAVLLAAYERALGGPARGEVELCAG